MFVYHEIPSHTRGAVLSLGLQRTSRGEKGSDAMIIKTDRYLDERCPRGLKEQEISRDNNIYAYIAVDDFVIDITDGKRASLQEFISGSAETVLRLQVDPGRCFVSDLDTYDALKEALGVPARTAVAEKLAQSYWNKLVPLTDFQIGTIRRPEVMITYDLSPDMLMVCD